MKEISELMLPADIRYTKDHEWARKEGSKVRIGISDYAQDQLGDIVFVELPPIGSSFSKGEQFGTVESVKAVAEIYMPLAGEVVAVNETLVDSPEFLNKDPYAEGWMIETDPSEPAQLESLMSREDYLEMLKGKK
jgi:glycine cleavage system H protein